MDEVHGRWINNKKIISPQTSVARLASAQKEVQLRPGLPMRQQSRPDVWSDTRGSSRCVSAPPANRSSSAGVAVVEAGCVAAWVGLPGRGGVRVQCRKRGLGRVVLMLPATASVRV